MGDGDGNPYLIDWESARAINPSHDIFQLALDWTGLSRCSINFSAFFLMVRAYKDDGTNIDYDLLEDALFVSLGNSLKSLIFNVKHTLNFSISAEERQIAGNEVSSTFQTIAYMHDNIGVVIEIAKNSHYSA